MRRIGFASCTRKHICPASGVVIRPTRCGASKHSNGSGPQVSPGRGINTQNYPCHPISNQYNNYKHDRYMYLLGNISHLLIPTLQTAFPYRTRPDTQVLSSSQQHPFCAMPKTHQPLLDQTKCQMIGRYTQESQLGARHDDMDD